MKLKTQKALACYDTAGRFEWVEPSPPDGYESERYTPVLVVPEAAVTACKHDGVGEDSDVRCCRDCGAWSVWDWGTGKWSRWQHPRILRVGRQR